MVPADEALEALHLRSSELQTYTELSIGSLEIFGVLDLAVADAGEGGVRESTCLMLQCNDLGQLRVAGTSISHAGLGLLLL